MIDKERKEKDTIMFNMAEETKRMEDNMIKQIKCQEEIVGHLEKESSTETVPSPGRGQG